MTPKEIAVARAAMRMIDRADLHELGDLTVSEIARWLNVDRSYLSRCFNNYCYPNLGRYLQTEKMTAFYLLIRYYRVPTVKAALEILDIRSPSHFIKRFKTFYGSTSGEVCRKAREAWEEPDKRNN